MTGVRINFTRQGFLRFDRFDGFERGPASGSTAALAPDTGNVQLYRWLSIDGHICRRRRLLRSRRPVPGRSRTAASASPCSRAAACRRRSTTGAIVVRSRESTGEHVYDLDIVYSRTTYQFTRQFFVRGIVQYDSSRSRADRLPPELGRGRAGKIGYGG